MERLGIVDEYRERRESIAERLSPSAKHQAFPRVYARPVPREATKVVDPTPPLRAEIAALNAQVALLKQENGRLTVMVAELSRPLVMRMAVPIEAVMNTFCTAMAAAGRTVEYEPWSLLWLRTSRRTRPIAYPRHVCMWLVRVICSEASSNMIGHAFGGKDHTSVLYANKNAPIIMSADPGLRHVAASVLRTYGVDPAELEKGGRP